MRALKVISVLVLMWSTSPVVAQTIGLKNFRQLFASYHRSTAVSVSDPAIVTAKQSVRSRLPLNGDVSEISSTTITAVYELAGTFCKRMIEIDAPRQPALRRAHSTVQFRAGPRAMTEPIRKKVISEYALLFWQREATAEETQLLIKTFEDASKDAPSTEEQTQHVLRVVCSAVAASIDSIAY